MLRDLTSQKKVDRELILAAIKSLQSKGWDVNPYTVADEAKISRQTLYRNSELMDLVSEARGGAGTGGAVSTDELTGRLAELEARNLELEEKVRQLELENENLVRSQQEAWHLGYQAGLKESGTAVAPERQEQPEASPPGQEAAETASPAGEHAEPAAAEEEAWEPAGAAGYTGIAGDEELAAAVPEDEPIVMGDGVAVSYEEWVVPAGEPQQAGLAEAAAREYVSEDWLREHGALADENEVEVEPGSAGEPAAGREPYSAFAPAAGRYEEPAVSPGEEELLAAGSESEQVPGYGETYPEPDSHGYPYAAEDEPAEHSAAYGAGYGYDETYGGGSESSGAAEASAEPPCSEEAFSAEALTEETGSGAAEPETGAEPEGETAAEEFSESDLRQLLQSRLRQQEESVKEPGGEEKKLAGSKFVGANRPTQEPPARRDFVIRHLPPDIRKACLVLGLRPEELTRELVHKAWKKEMANPGTHPDVGGDTEIAVYLNTAKDTLFHWLDAQAPKLAKRFGSQISREYPRPQAPDSGEQQAPQPGEQQAPESEPQS